MMVLNSGSRSSLSGAVPLAGWSSEARPTLAAAYTTGTFRICVQVQVRNLVGEVGGQAQQQVHGLVHDFVDAGVGAVGLVDQQDHGQVRGQGLAQHEAGLRQRALGGVDEQDDAVDHGQAALHLAAEVGVAGGVDHVDGDGLAVGGRAVVGHRGVLGQDGDALFALQVTGVHDAVFKVVVLGKGVGLLEHGVDQGGLAVVNVGHDRDVAQVIARCSATAVLVVVSDMRYDSIQCGPAESPRRRDLNARLISVSGKSHSVWWPGKWADTTSLTVRQLMP